MIKKQKSLPNQCEFCKKEFKTVGGFERHKCEKKLRWDKKDTKEFVVSFSIFKSYLKRNSNGKREKTPKEFVNSRYYKDFFKLGEFITKADVAYVDEYVDYLWKNDIQSKSWCSDQTYSAYIKHMLETETPERALERSMLAILNWSKATGNSWDRFFCEVNPNTAVRMILDGKISPWILYTSASADNLFDRFNSEHFKMLKSVVNENFWRTKLTSYKKDVKFILGMLNEAGL